MIPPALESAFRFDPDEHRYWLGDEELLSVTGVLARMGLGPNYSRVSQRRLAAAADRGDSVHAALLAYHRAESLPDHFGSSYPEWANLWDHYGPWATQMGLQAVELECPVISLTHKYAGHLDLFGLIDSTVVIADWKSRDPHPADGLQLAGYLLAVLECWRMSNPGEPVPAELAGARRCVIRVYPNRKPRLLSYHEPQDLARFKTLAAAARICETYRR